MEPWVPTSRLDRVLAARMDEAWVAAQWDAPGARLLTVDDRGRLPRSLGGDPLGAAATAGPHDPQRHLLVGAIDGQPWFATAGSFDGEGATLRELIGVLPETEADLATTAVALVHWHRSALFCGRCGGPTDVREGGHQRGCRQCGAEHYPRTDPAVIVAILDDHGRLLLGHHVGWEDTRVSILAGFVEAGESLEQAVHREIAEEAGLTLTALRYVGSQPWPFPRSLMLGFVARARGSQVRVDGSEITWANFYTVEQVERLVAAGELTLPLRSSIASRIISAWRAGDLTV